jgi:RimJ/RimL family protein N-acetyltransferase
VVHQRLERERFRSLAVVDKATDTLMGHCGLNTVTEMDQVEVMYALGSEYWGNGYATEVAQASVAWGFQNLEIAEIIGLAKVDNPASQKVLIKCGLEEIDRHLSFAFRARARQARHRGRSRPYWGHGSPRDNVCCRVLFPAPRLFLLNRGG